MSLTEKDVKESKEYYTCLELLTSDNDPIDNAFSIAKYILEQKQQAKSDERKRIVEAIRENACNLTYKVKDLNNEEYILIKTSQLAELEKGD